MYPVLFKIGPLTIHTYGVMLVIAFLTGLYLARKEARRKSIDDEIIVNFTFYALISGIAGARLYYILFYDLKSYLAQPAEILFIWKGGLAVHGGILGGLLAALWFAKRWKLSFWKLADTVTPAFILGQAIGRVGCFLNGCCHGLPTNLPWGITFPETSPGSFEHGCQPLHPTQAYAIFLNLLIFMIIWKLRKKTKQPGYLFLLYVILYSTARAFVEIFRGDSLHIWRMPLKTAQVISILAIIIALFLMNFLGKKNKNA